MSSEVVLPRLLDKLMEVCLATAGAERGAFVVGGGRPAVRARRRRDREADLAAQDTARGRRRTCRGRVVDAGVAGRGEALVRRRRLARTRISRDPYVAGARVRSLLALPILRQARLMGVLYLENNLATRVFTPERVRLLQLLSSQIATSLENSLLFEELSQEIEERKRAEAAMRFLAEAGAALGESLDYQRTLTEVARLAVPSWPTGASVDVCRGRRGPRVAVAHRATRPRKQALLEQLQPARRTRRAPPGRAPRSSSRAPRCCSREVNRDDRGPVRPEPEAAGRWRRSAPRADGPAAARRSGACWAP